MAGRAAARGWGAGRGSWRVAGAVCVGDRAVRLHHSVKVLRATELHTQKCLKWSISRPIYFNTHTHTMPPCKCHHKANPARRVGCWKQICHVRVADAPLGGDHHWQGLPGSIVRGLGRPCQIRDGQHLGRGLGGIGWPLALCLRFSLCPGG